MEEWISLSKFMKKMRVGHDVALQMLYDGKFEYKLTEGNRYKIRVGGDTVPRSIYEEEKEKRIQAETRLKMAISILEGG